MIIKVTHASMGARRGGARVGRHPHPSKKRSFFSYIGGLFATFSSYGGLFATFFSFWGGLLLLFTSWWGPFLGLAPPPSLRKFLRAPMIAAIAVREHPPRKFFLRDRNLVSSGHVLLRFCLKNDKNNDKL